MTEPGHSHGQPSNGGSFLTSRAGIVFLAFLAMGGALLFTEHRAHVLGILPFLLILACPLLHVFHHGRHGGHGGHGGHQQPRGQTGPDLRGSTGNWDASKGGKP